MTTNYKHNFTSVLLFLGTIVVAQVFSPEDVCQKDGSLILKENSKIVNGVIQTTYPSGEIRSFLTVENGQLSGDSKWYYLSGEEKCKYSFENGLLDGEFTIWYENGRKRCHNIFKSGKQLHYWGWWDQTGEIIQFENQDSEWGINSKFIPYSDNSIKTMSGDEITFEYPDFVISKYCGLETNIEITYFIDEKGYVREIRLVQLEQIISLNEAIIMTLLSNKYTPRNLRDLPTGTWNFNKIKMT